MLKSIGTALLALLAALPAGAAGPQLVCFGNEPSWSLEFGEPGTARLALPERAPLEYRGGETRLEPLKERAWRGKPANGRSGDLVAFLRESACSDGMSDTKHPVTARVSLPGGRFLAGCCRVPAATGATSAAPLAIEGPTWRLASVGGKDPAVTGTSSRPVTVRFEAGRIDGFSGCNQMFGAYTIDGDRVTFGPLAGSMMACAPTAMALESAVQGALAGALHYAIAGDRLSLTPASGAALEFRAEPAPTLGGVAWSVTGFNNGRHAVVSPVLGTTLTLSFGAGVVTGKSGCNSFRATYKSEGDQLTIGPAATTRKACTGEGVMQQEREFLAALETATTWSVRGGMLDVHRADGERVLTANGSPK